MTEPAIPGPVVEIDLAKVRHNAATLCRLYGAKGVEVIGVTKAVLGLPAVASALVEAGITTLADSRLANLRRMREAGVEARFALLRTPPSCAEAAVRWADVSLNTELATLRALAAAARAVGRVHQVLLMVEMGDLREGVPLDDFPDFFAAARGIAGIEVVGIGCNLGCFGGVAPDQEKMAALSRLAGELEAASGQRLEVVSGGNSANHDWLTGEGSEPARVNSLRLGELILLGRESLRRRPVPGLHGDAFTLTAEVIEANVKPSVPEGTRCQDAFGATAPWEDRGPLARALLALGRQDVRVSGLRPRCALAILGASSDHLLLDTSRHPLAVGERVAFDLDYRALMSAMASPFVEVRPR